MISRVLLLLGAALMVVAWALMPDAATNDAAAIARAVAATADRVRLSAVAQLAACAAMAPQVLRVMRESRSRAGFVGASLFVIGLMGMAADAVYHQAAVQLTAADVAGEATARVLNRMQTEDIRSLVPLLLAYPIGAVVLVIGLAREGLVPRWARIAVFAGLGWVVIGVVLARIGVAPRRWVALGFLSALSIALAGLSFPPAAARTNE